MILDRLKDQSSTDASRLASKLELSLAAKATLEAQLAKFREGEAAAEKSSEQLTVQSSLQQELSISHEENITLTTELRATNSAAPLVYSELAESRRAQEVLDGQFTSFAEVGKPIESPSAHLTPNTPDLRPELNPSRTPIEALEADVHRLSSANTKLKSSSLIATGWN